MVMLAQGSSAKLEYSKTLVLVQAATNTLLSHFVSACINVYLNRVITNT
jgi:hypothetical protein